MKSVKTKRYVVGPNGIYSGKSYVRKFMRYLKERIDTEIKTKKTEGEKK